MGIHSTRNEIFDTTLLNLMVRCICIRSSRSRFDVSVLNQNIEYKVVIVLYR